MVSPRRLIIVGCGGMGREASWLARGSSSPFDVVGFLDDADAHKGSRIKGVLVGGGSVVSGACVMMTNVSVGRHDMLNINSTRLSTRPSASAVQSLRRSRSPATFASSPAPRSARVPACATESRWAADRWPAWVRWWSATSPRGTWWSETLHARSGSSRHSETSSNEATA
jgi:hypothetical protein